MTELKLVVWKARILRVLLLSRNIVTIEVRGDTVDFSRRGNDVPIECRLVNTLGQDLVEKIDICGFALANVYDGIPVYLDTFGLPFSEDWIGAFLIPRTEE